MKLSLEYTLSVFVLPRCILSMSVFQLKSSVSLDTAVKQIYFPYKSHGIITRNICYSEKTSVGICDRIAAEVCGE
jgi:hypothetical protein